MGVTKNISVLNEVAQTIESALIKTQAYFHKTALDALEVQVAKGNNVYTVMVDGKPAADKNAVYSAKSKVKFNFPLKTVDLALSIMKSALQTEIGARANATGAMRASVRIWYGGIGKAPKEVSGSSEIENFEVGDYVMLVPDIFYFAFSNSAVKQKTGKGFMARTAVRIRRAINITKKTAGISVVVGRSLAAASYMNIPESTGKKKSKHKRPFPGTSVAGVPVLYIRWKTNRFNLLGV